MDNQILSVKLFELYAKHIWPWHRLFVKNKISRRCNLCAASEHMVTLHTDGICSLCLDSQKALPVPVADHTSLQQQLDKLLEQGQALGRRQYDALALFSGGKDSTYMIERIKRQFPNLRMLAYTIDNGFMSPVARSNVEELIQKLDIDHIFVRPARSFYIKLFRYCITHLNQSGGYGTLDFTDGEFMLDTARKMAVEKQIPIILAGYSKYQVQDGLKINDFIASAESEAMDRTHTAGIPLDTIFDDQEDRDRWWHGTKYRKDEIARLVFPLYAWDMSEDAIKKQVTDWGLLTKKQHSPAVTNHQLIPVLGVVDVHQFGYSSFEPEFCRMIREGKADRHSWQMVFEFLEYCSRTGLFVRAMVTDRLGELNLTLEDVKIRFN